MPATPGPVVPGPRPDVQRGSRKSRAPGEAPGARRAPKETAAPDDVASLPVSTLPGAGPATAARLRAAGLNTVADVVGFLPRAYDDLRDFTPLGDLPGREEGTVVLVRGTVTRVNVFPGRFLAVYLGDGNGHTLVARWFRVPGGMGRAYEKGREVALAGPLRFGTDGQPELSHPTNLTASLTGAGGGSASPSPAAGQAGGLGIRPRYTVIPGVAGRVLERIVAAAVERHAGALPDALPASTRERLGLPSLAEALRIIHRPDREATPELLDALVGGRSEAHRRLAIEDLLVIQMGLARRRAQARAQPGRPCGAPPEHVLERVRSALPFALTGAQSRAIGEIQADLSGPEPMQRLLVGDVGSGKTAVAFAAAAHAALSGGQSMLMAPTEVLAEQHARTLTPLFAKLGLRVGLLTASTPRPQRETLLALARAGAVALLVGTQSLLADRVALPDLRLAIVDEQHRFGVAQRARLRGRDEADTGTAPHLLVMTATPIPRTLAFTLYGDLDLSVLDELPPGRKPVATRVLTGAGARRTAEAAIRQAIDANRRVFVVCPVREVTAREGGVTAVDRQRELAATLAPTEVGLVHGAMDARSKDAVLRAFAQGRLQVLVATTVIEVGIDVPEASLMVVEEAERFGLAQLHQLRGRVGRGSEAADCLLLNGNPGRVPKPSRDELRAAEPRSARREAGASADAGIDFAEGLQRLKVIAGSNDGFRIAEADLELRGCGDLFGVRQAGMPRLRFADLAGMGRLLELVRAESMRIVEEDPTLSLPEHQPLRRAVEARWAAAEIFGEEAG